MKPPSAPDAPSAASPADGLIFAWERRSWSRLRLVPMIFFSLLAHAAIFYILQVSYTPTGSQLPPPAQVVLVPLDQPEHAPLARWLAMSDPALMARPATPSTRQTLAALEFRYVPSYDTGLPAFKELDAGSGAASVSTPPRPLPPGPLAPSLLPPLPGEAAASDRARTTAKPVKTTAGQVSRVVFSGEAAVHAPVQPLPPRHTAVRGAKPLEPTIFLLGVRSSGGAPFLFRRSAPFRATTGTGDAEAEESARAYLRGITFGTPPLPASGEGENVVWGWVTFYWGNDVYPSVAASSGK